MVKIKECSILSDTKYLIFKILLTTNSYHSNWVKHFAWIISFHLLKNCYRCPHFLPLPTSTQLLSLSLALPYCCLLVYINSLRSYHGLVTCLKLPRIWFERISCDFRALGVNYWCYPPSICKNFLPGIHKKLIRW